MTCKYCGHEAEHHAPLSGCMLSDCPCGQFAPVEEPPEEEGGELTKAIDAFVTGKPIPLLKAQRETEAVPDIRPGGVYFAEPTNYHRDDDLDSMLLVSYFVLALAGAAMGLFVGWLLWGLTW